MIHCENCLHTMDYMPDNHIDLTVTSPPYDDLRMYNGYTFDFEPIAQQLYRVTKKGGVVVWVVADATIKGSESGTSFRQALHFMDLGFKLHDTMLYERSPAFPSSATRSTRYSQSFEYMFVFSKGIPTTHNLIVDRQNRWGGFGSFGTQSERLKDGTLKPRRKTVVAELGVRFNIWNYPSGWNNSRDKTEKEQICHSHPAVFPYQLAEDHIKSWSNEGDLIYDPFSGSGTTWLAAIKNNRRFIGSEISKEYVELAQRRIASVIC